jgi:hypothetical protein
MGRILMKRNRWVAPVMCGLVMAAMLGALPAGAGQKSAASVSGNVITLKGTERQTATGHLSAGAYIVRRTAGEGFLGFTIKDKADAVLYTNFLNDLSNTSLVIVGGELFKPGDVVFEVDGINPWTVTVTRAEASAAVALPQVLAGAERATVVSQPFKAAAGDLVMSYTYKAAPKGTGTLTICNIATGKTVPMSKMMYAGKTSGGWTMTLPEAGVYVAATIFPLGSGGGEVKLSQ